MIMRSYPRHYRRHFGGVVVGHSRQNRPSANIAAHEDDRRLIERICDPSSTEYMQLETLSCGASCQD